MIIKLHAHMLIDILNYLDVKLKMQTVEFVICSHEKDCVYFSIAIESR